LLGLDVVDRLQSDLSIHITRNEKQSDEKYTKKIDDLYLENSKIEDEISHLLQKKGDLANKLGSREKKIEEIQGRISSEGGAFANKRDQLVNDKKNLGSRIEQISEEIRQMASGVLPFAIVPRYCISLRDRILKEQDMSRNLDCNKKTRQLLLNLKDNVISVISKSPSVNPKNMIKDGFNSKTLISEIDGIFNNHLGFVDAGNTESNTHENLKIIHHLSAVEQNKILYYINDTLSITTKIKNLSKELELSTIQLQRIEGSLKKAPSDEVMGPLVEELTTINQEIGSIQTTIKQIDEDIAGKTFKQKNINFQLREISSEKKEYDTMQRGLKLAFKVREALKDYETQTKKERISNLEESLLDCLNELLHKDIFYRVKIDPDHFTVSLFDKADNMIIKDQLSLGEKQIYAIAMLWALARSSGRPLPFIIDTPLGRLDSEHRLNLVQNFFPFASHQVIIFSTDTEIDREYFNELSEYISHSYKLEYDQKLGFTKVEEGYFWKDAFAASNSQKEISGSENQANDTNNEDGRAKLADKKSLTLNAKLNKARRTP
jgi:DNA sulfur modification protein DndD